MYKITNLGKRGDFEKKGRGAGPPLPTVGVDFQKSRKMAANKKTRGLDFGTL